MGVCGSAKKKENLKAKKANHSGPAPQVDRDMTPPGQKKKLSTKIKKAGSRKPKRQEMESGGWGGMQGRVVEMTGQEKKKPTWANALRH